jgi:hypothetical protein
LAADRSSSAACRRGVRGSGARVDLEAVARWLIPANAPRSVCDRLD